MRLREVETSVRMLARVNRTDEIRTGDRCRVLGGPARRLPLPLCAATAPVARPGGGRRPGDVPGGASGTGVVRGPFERADLADRDPAAQDPRSLPQVGPRAGGPRRRFRTVRPSSRASIAGDAGTFAPEAWAGEPSRDLETREFWDVFGRCLSRLPKGLADAFFLREVDGLGADEVQELLGISPANLWARLHRARTLLRGCLEIGWFGRRAIAHSGKVK